jgi:hypothetical protein
VYLGLAALLAIMVGIFQMMLGVLRLGVLVDFLSHPVVVGFTNGAAIIIATSQLSKLFGVTVQKAEHHYETVWRVLVALGGSGSGEGEQRGCEGDESHPRTVPLTGSFLKRMHRLVAEAEVVADFVHQHMRDEMLERFVAALDPFVEDRLAEQPDAVGQGARVADALLVKRQALVDTGQLERVLDPEPGERLLVGELLDQHHDIAEMRGELRRQPGQSGARHRLHLVGGGGRADRAGHRAALGGTARACKAGARSLGARLPERACAQAAKR